MKQKDWMQHALSQMPLFFIPVTLSIRKIVSFVGQHSLYFVARYLIFFFTSFQKCLVHNIYFSDIITIIIHLPASLSILIIEVIPSYCFYSLSGNTLIYLIPVFFLKFSRSFSLSPWFFFVYSLMLVACIDVFS